VETAKEVKIFGLNAFLIERYRLLSEAFYAANRRLVVRRAGWGGVLTIGTIGYVAYGHRLAHPPRHHDRRPAFLSGSFRRLRGLIDGFRAFRLSQDRPLPRRPVLLLPHYTGIVSPPNARPFPAAVQQGFIFENVCFRYQGSEHWAVRHLTFELRAGEVLALVGENGAGKTTLVKLLARLYDPDEGRILLDGHDLREYDLLGLRANLGVIFQDFVRYHMTASENIAVGRIEAAQDQPRIEAAAQRSLADDVIRKLPEGYDQVIGKRFRKGVDLSGGEWQKVAIARAYMRDAQVLILDEPTASLDARAEFHVFQRFKELSHAKTAVLISHRFSSVRMADRILVLGNGQIEAMGTHASCWRRAAVTRSSLNCRQLDTVRKALGLKGGFTQRAQRTPRSLRPR
jgi:ATP-binding cassette subfamily B protein